MFSMVSSRIFSERQYLISASEWTCVVPTGGAVSATTGGGAGNGTTPVDRGAGANTVPGAAGGETIEPGEVGFTTGAGEVGWLWSPPTMRTPTAKSARRPR